MMPILLWAAEFNHVLQIITKLWHWSCNVQHLCDKLCISKVDGTEILTSPSQIQSHKSSVTLYLTLPVLCFLSCRVWSYWMMSRQPMWSVAITSKAYLFTRRSLTGRRGCQTWRSLSLLSTTTWERWVPLYRRNLPERERWWEGEVSLSLYRRNLPERERDSGRERWAEGRRWEWREGDESGGREMRAEGDERGGRWERREGDESGGREMRAEGGRER